MDGDAKISGQLPGSISCGDPEESGYEGNYISLGTAAEAVESLAQFQAGRAIIMERAPCHSESVQIQPIPFSRIQAGDAVFQRLKVTHVFSPFSFVISQATHLPSDPVYSVVKVHEGKEILPSLTRQRNEFLIRIYFREEISSETSKNPLFLELYWIRNPFIRKKSFHLSPVIHCLFTLFFINSF